MKRVKFLLLSFAVLSFFILSTVRSFSQESEESTGWSNLSFATDLGILKFFDPATGKIYVFSEGSGELKRIYKLERLDKDLIKEEIPRSLFSH